MTPRAPAIEPLPAGVHTVSAHEAAGAARVEPGAWAYLTAGAGAETTLRANAAAWTDIRLLPRVLRPPHGGHTRIQLLGRPCAHPMLVAPMAFQHLAHPDGEQALACAAAAQEAGYVVAMQSGTPVESIAEAVLGDPGRGPLWFQLYWQPDRAFVAALVQRVEAAGCEALVLTVDAPVQGLRERERNLGFTMPPALRAVHLDGAAPSPGGPGLAGGLAHVPTWDDVAWLRARTRLPIVMKGVLHPADAREAVQCGVSAIVVSNHGGRTLDGAVPTAHALPVIADAVGDRIELLVDGGIRHGVDVLRACALGARAVLVGRPCLWGLASAGAVGAAHVLRLLRDELEIAMVQAGCTTLADAGGVLLLPPRGNPAAAGSIS